MRALIMATLVALIAVGVAAAAPRATATATATAAAILPRHPPRAASVRVYPARNDPAAHPDYSRYPTTPPTYSTFTSQGDVTPLFATLRGFTVAANNSIVGYKDVLDQFTAGNESLGTIVWPMYPLLFADNVNDVVDEVARRGLFLTDVWGYVPGSASGTGGWRENVWQQFTPPAGALAHLEAALGDRWLGMDVGEQDGRYIGGYSTQFTGAPNDRLAQLRNFQRHFEAMGKQLGNRLSTLVTLSLPHYIIKAGYYTTVGAESAQALISGPVFYSFIRGACKQYGLLAIGNVSVYNRFGYKSYPAEAFTEAVPTAAVRGGTASERARRRRTRGSALAAPVQLTSGGPDGYSCNGGGGPTCGTSLNLMKRLMYQQIMYNTAYVSFENAWFYGGNNTLSPVGRIQVAAKKFVADYGDSLGTHVAQVGILLPHNNGWVVPRQLYSSSIYRVWGTIPYEAGDYLTDGLLRLVYPTYQDSSYFHNERGFQTPTPYGDGADVLLTDAAPWVLQRYDTVVVAGHWTATRGDVMDGLAEVAANLGAYVTSGGRLVITAGALAAFDAAGVDTQPLLGVSCAAPSAARGCPTLANGTVVSLFGRDSGAPTGSVVEPHAFSACPVEVAAGRQSVPLATVATPTTMSLAVEVWSPAATGGSVVALSSPYGVPSAATLVPTSATDVTIPTPFPLLAHASRVLDAALGATTLFTANDNATLSTIVSRVNATTYTLCVSNPQLQQQPLAISSRIGAIASVTEIALDHSEKSAVGYLPDGFAGTDIGTSTATTVAGGDVRVFRVSLVDGSTTAVALPVSEPKPRPQGVCLRLGAMTALAGGTGAGASVREAIAARSSFHTHFDCVMVDYHALTDADPGALATECEWLKEQGVRVILDATESIDLFPRLRLVNNSMGPYNASMAQLTAGIKAVGHSGGCGAGDATLVVSLHRVPENDFTTAQAIASFEASLKVLAAEAAAANVTLHLRQDIKNEAVLGSLSAADAWLTSTGLYGAGVRLASETGSLVRHNTAPAAAAAIVQRASDLVMVGAVGYDAASTPYSDRVAVSSPFVDSSVASSVSALVKSVCGVRLCAYGSASGDGSQTRPIVLVLDAAFATQDDEYADAAWLEAQLL